MNHIEKYSDRKLLEMREKCKYAIVQTIYEELFGMKDIFTIALVEINRELDERKIRKEGQNE